MRRVWVGLAAVVGLGGACGDDSTAGDVPDVPGEVGADADGDVEPDVDGDADPDTVEEVDDGSGLDGEADVPPELVWGDCDVTDWPLGYPQPADGVECTTLEVPLNHDDPAAGTIPLNVGRHRSRHFPTGLAVFHLSGGPGGAAVTQSGIIPLVMGTLRTDFDMVYVDQRGTGALGYMDCPGGYPEGEDDWIDCASRYVDRDLDHYLTVDAAHDIDFVRRRLGYERIYIRGGSYGTRLGLEVLRQHGESVIAAVLDGLAPPDLDLFGEGVGTFDHGIDLLVADCSTDPSCLAVAPDLLGDLRTRREQLRATPRPITLDGYPDAETEEYYLMFLEAFLLDAGWRYRVPRAVHEALAGDHTRWNRLMSEATGYTVADGTKSGATATRRAPFDWVPRRRPVLAHEYVSPGLFITVMCAEFYPNSGGIAALETALAAQEWPDDSHLQMARACPSWDVAPLDAVLRQPVTSAVPTLLMNGAIDLNTYAEWGAHAAATLSNATNLVVPYATHSTMSVSCAAQIMTRFIMHDGDISAVDTSCLTTISPPDW